MTYTKKQIRQFRAIAKCAESLTSTEIYLLHLLSIKRVLDRKTSYNRAEIAELVGCSDSSVSYMLIDLSYGFIVSGHEGVYGDFSIQVYGIIHDILISRTAPQYVQTALGNHQRYAYWLFCVAHGCGRIDPRVGPEIFGGTLPTFNHALWQLETLGLIQYSSIGKCRWLTHVYGLGEVAPSSSGKKKRPSQRGQSLDLDAHLRYAQENGLVTSVDWANCSRLGQLPEGILSSPWAKFTDNSPNKFFGMAWGDSDQRSYRGYYPGRTNQMEVA